MGTLIGALIGTLIGTWRKGDAYFFALQKAVWTKCVYSPSPNKSLINEMIASRASFSSLPSIKSVSFAPFAAANNITDIMLFPSTRLLSYSTSMVLPNWQDVSTNLFAALACSPSLFFIVIVSCIIKLLFCFSILYRFAMTCFLTAMSMAMVLEAASLPVSFCLAQLAMSDLNVFVLVVKLLVKCICNID